MRISISKARSRLAELADYVMAAPGRRVFIEQRGRAERLVLISESYMKYLELMGDKAASQGITHDGKPFKLEGSIELLVSADELEALMEEEKAERIRKAAEPFEEFED